METTTKSPDTPAVKTPPKVSPEKKFRLVLYSYTSEAAGPIENLLRVSGLGEFVNASKASLSDGTGGACDIAVAVFAKGDKIEQFVSDVTSLHIVRKIPSVLAIADGSVREELEEHKDELATDDVLYMPVSVSSFSKTVMTHVVALKIERDKKGRLTDKTGRAPSLGEILVEHGLITPLRLKKALDHQRKTNLRLGDALVELGYIDEDQKMHFLASQLGVELATAKQYASADISVVGLIPERIAKRHHCLAVEKENGELTVAMVDVLDLRLLDSLRDLTEQRIKPVLGRREDIDTTIERFYRDIASNKEASDLMTEDAEVEFVEEKEDEVDLEDAVAAGAELGIVKLVNMMIANAVRDKASDIHIESMEKELVVRYRLDGECRKVMSPPKRSHQAIITRIKILSNLDIAERRLPQDGRMGVKMGMREVDIRVSILPTIFGEKAVLRILDKEAFERNVSNLGFTQYDQEIFKLQIVKPYGMVIVTGPTGSGKSTTLYSALQQIKNVTRNIVTVEDPVEFHIDGVNQVHVNNKIGLTFASSLRSILRQDPDIVLIGEIRDAETADIAIKMALTGHLVFSTLHTNDAASAIARFTDIGIPPLLLGSSLNLIIAQRLVRKICTKCKTEYDPPPEMLEQLRLTGKENLKFFIGQGCVNCNGTGYSGRTALFEMIAVSKEIRKLILRNASTMDIQDLARKEGMRTLRQAGIDMALKGTTTIEQVIAVTTEI